MLQRLHQVVRLTLPLLVLATVSCASNRGTRTSHDCSWCYRSGSDEAVLSAVLASLPGIRLDKYLIIDARSRALMIESDWLENQLATAGKSVPRELFAMVVNYDIRNARCHPLTISKSRKVKLVDSEYLAKMFDGDAIGGWKRFWVEFPGADALVELSLPGYSPSGDWAILSYSASRGSVNGDFVAVLLRHREGGWAVEWSQILFES